MFVPFSSNHLTQLGFTPAIPLQGADPIAAPSARGVYVVTARIGEPSFLKNSVGGRFKGKDPSVTVEELERNWIDDADVLYIGCTNNLKRRVNELRCFGLGQPVGHWGGRYLWQLDSPESLRVRWLENAEPAIREAELIAEFVGHFDALPFANLKQPSVPVAVL